MRLLGWPLTILLISFGGEIGMLIDVPLSLQVSIT